MIIDTALLIAIALKDTTPGKRLAQVVTPGGTPSEQKQAAFDKLAQTLADATLMSAGAPAETQRVNTSARVASATSVNVLASGAVRIDDPILPNRRFVMVQNLGPNAIWVGMASSVATGTGINVPGSGGTLSLDVGPDVTLFAIASTADQVSGTTNTRVIQAS